MERRGRHEGWRRARIVLALLGLLFSAFPASAAVDSCGFMAGSAAAGAGDVSLDSMLSPDHGHERMPDMPPGQMDCDIHCAVGCYVFISPALIFGVSTALATADSPRLGPLKSITPIITTPPPRIAA